MGRKRSMEKKKCPVCGMPLIREVYEGESRGSLSASRSRIVPSGCSSCNGSIDVYASGSTGPKARRIVYRCPNPECGYLTTADC